MAKAQLPTRWLAHQRHIIRCRAAVGAATLLISAQVYSTAILFGWWRGGPRSLPGRQNSTTTERETTLTPGDFAHIYLVRCALPRAK